MRCYLWLLGMAMGTWTSAAWLEAQEDAVPKMGNRAKGDDELLIFKDLPIVVTASRQAAPVSRATAPVSVVTAEDIHYGGQTSIPEILQFVPGVDVQRVDRNRWAVGVRGLHDTYSDRTLVLIDGRNGENPAFGGPEWLRYPVFMEDIERVEVVRAPGGAAWGANAFNGVVNIITKKPKDTQGVFATGTVNELGDHSSQVRWGAKKGKWIWRMSLGYTEEESSDDAIHDDKFSSDDYNRRTAFDGLAEREIAATTKVSFGVGHQYQEIGDFELSTLDLRRQGQLDTTRAFARLDHDFGKDMQAYVQWTGNYMHSNLPVLLKGRQFLNDLEGQVQWTPAQNHHLTIGSNARWMELTTEVQRVTDLRFRNAPVDEYFAGLFAIHRWDINQRLTYELQARGDWYSETHADWATRATLLYALGEHKEHTLRWSASRAFRMPYIGIRELQFQRRPLPAFPPFIPAGLFAIDALPNGDLDNESTCSLEVGYVGKLPGGFTLRADGYYQGYQDLIGFEDINFRTLPFIGTINQFRAKNHESAYAYGGEVELAYTAKLGRFSVWYGHNNFEQEHDQRALRSLRPGQDKLGFTGRLNLPEQVTLNLNYRYTSIVRGDDNNGFQDAPVLHRLDFTASKRFYKERFEIMGGVSDILNNDRNAVHGIGSATSHETPGRNAFLRFQLKF